MRGEQTSSISGELHMIRVVSTVVCYPTRLFVFTDTVTFLSAWGV